MSPPEAIRRVGDGDWDALAALWAQALPHDPVPAERLREVFGVGSPSRGSGEWLAETAGRCVGFISAVPPEPDRDAVGVLRAILVAPEARTTALAEQLVRRAEASLRQRGAQRVRVGPPPPGVPYLLAGVDRKDPATNALLNRLGYREVERIQDMDVPVAGYRPNAHVQEAERRAREYGVRLEDYAPPMLPAMERFAQALGIPQWFLPGWQRRYQRATSALTAWRADRIVGWAEYHLARPTASFGPLGVLPEHRGHGIGTWIVARCMEYADRFGAQRLWAHWTNTPFYRPIGWRVCREYRVLEKEL